MYGLGLAHSQYPLVTHNNKFFIATSPNKILHKMCHKFKKYMYYIIDLLLPHKRLFFWELKLVTIPKKKKVNLLTSKSSFSASKITLQFVVVSTVYPHLTHGYDCTYIGIVNMINVSTSLVVSKVLTHNTSRYKGPLTDEVAFAKALDGGLKSLEFSKLIHIIAEELKTLCELEETVNLINSVDESSSFLLELSSFLKELKCPYKCLVTGMYFYIIQPIYFALSSFRLVFCRVHIYFDVTTAIWPIVIVTYL